MNIGKLIFSKEKKQRIATHILFWCAGYMFFVISYPPTGWGSSKGLTGDGITRFYEMVLIRNAFTLLNYIIFSYVFVYFLMPVLFWRKKYAKFISMLLLLIAVTVFLNYISFAYLYNPIMKYTGLEADPSYIILSNSFKIMIAGPSYTPCIFIIINFFKDWQQKQQDNFNLQKENTAAEMQLLKAQIHPHFLFNTLNNIYSFTLNKSPQAKDILKKLEDILHYMIEECEQPLVPVKNEIKIIQDYFDLERIRYGNSLDMQLEITGNYNNKTIAPLLMIPFVENSFKHGTSKILRSPWIKLFIQADENVLHFILTNSKPAGEMVKGTGGIGLSNVKKRLDLLYPSGHLLTIEHTVNTFTVNMQVPLQQMSEAN